MCNKSSLVFGEKNFTDEMIKGKRVLEVGSYDYNGNIRPIVMKHSPKEYVGVDVEMGKGVDIVCNSEDLLERFGKDSFDFVVSTEMLEHVRDWQRVVYNLKSVCKPDGYMFITTRSKGFFYHPYPEDHWRYEIADMYKIFPEFDISHCVPDPEGFGVFMLGKRKEIPIFSRIDLKLYHMACNKRVGDGLKVFWFGYGGSQYRAEDLRSIIENLGMELITISEWKEADVIWDQKTWLSNHLVNADIIILPLNYEKQGAKSNNRLTQAMSLGKPIIASPLPAYIDIAEKYHECFKIARTEEEWKERLIELRDDPVQRRDIGNYARVVAKDYSIKQISTKWLDVFDNLEKVDIIIPTYNNLECLQMCIASIKRCTNVLYNLIIVNTGPDEDTHNYLVSRGDVIYIRKQGFNFAQAVNVGLKNAKSKYIAILNDDLIVSNGWLSTLKETLKDDKIGAVGVLSNCDKGWLHNRSINIGGVELGAGVNTIDEIKPIVEQIYGFRTESYVQKQNWIAFYCLLMRKDVVDKVGLLDEKFTNSGEDVDYCYRISKQGYDIVQNYGAFVFHFGAMARKAYEKENSEKYHKEQNDTTTYLHSKWEKESVVIYTGPAWEQWDYKNVDEGGIGGSETWAVCLAREFDKLGYNVKLFSDCSESGLMDGDVEYIHYSEFPEYVKYNWIDNFITSRTTDSLDYPIRCGKKFVMIHDIWLLSDRYKIPMDVDKYCVLSQWHKDFVKGYHNIPEEKLWMTSNGLDLSRFEKEAERNPYRLIWSSSVDRGLDNLLYLFDFIKEDIPELELHIYYGMENTEKWIHQRGNQLEIEQFEKTKAMMDKEGVFYHGRIGQKELAIEFKKSALWAYPTNFTESFCISSLEAQAAGVPVVASNYAGLRTTIGKSGALIGSGKDGEAYTKEFRTEFVEQCVKLLKDKKEWEKWSERGYKNVGNYTWAKVAKEWVKQFKN